MMRSKIPVYFGRFNRFGKRSEPGAKKGDL